MVTQYIHRHKNSTHVVPTQSYISIRFVCSCVRQSIHDNNGWASICESVNMSVHCLPVSPHRSIDRLFVRSLYHTAAPLIGGVRHGGGRCSVRVGARRVGCSSCCCCGSSLVLFKVIGHAFVWFGDGTGLDRHIDRGGVRLEDWNLTILQCPRVGCQKTLAHANEADIVAAPAVG